jgi:short-subunit dehydrogenase
MDLPYRMALVTGASSGIGAAFARELAARRADLVITARRTDRLDWLAADLRSEYGVEVEAIAADLTDDKQLSLLAERLDDPERPVDLLVNNAGSGSAGDFADQPIDAVLQQVRLNIIAPLTLIRAVVPRMMARRSGGIVNVSSLGGFMPMPGSATYGATKAFSSAFGESLALELRGHGIHVTTLWAGLTRTEFHQAGGYSPDTLPKVAWSSPESVAAAGLAAVAAGRTTTAPGRSTKAFVPVARFMPRAMLRRMVKPYVHE